MNWHEFLLLLHLATKDYCYKSEPQNYKTCYLQITDCVLDGENFDWCIQDREKQIGCFPTKN